MMAKELDGVLEKVDLSKKLDKAEYKEIIGSLRDRLGELQRRARDLKIPVMVVFEGWDASGKGTIVSEMIQALDPRGFIVFTTREDTEEDRQRPYLWRFWVRVARQGRIAIFDRSWYMNLLVAMSGKSSKIPPNHVTFDELVSFERQLTDDGVLIIKFFLHISKAEQKERLGKLQADKNNAWRVTEQDWKNHRKYDKGQVVIEEMLRLTDTDFAPWTIVEAHDKRFAIVKVMNTIIRAMEMQVARKERELALEKEHLASPSISPGMVDYKQTAWKKKFTSSVLTDVDLSRSLEEEEYQARLAECQKRLKELGLLCYKEQIPVVVVFEGWDAAGKGGSIRHLIEKFDHRGYTVIPIGSPTEEDKGYHYLWRFWKNIPRKGHCAIFDRSWYGRVLVERIEGFCREDEWRRAYKEINEMEAQLHCFGAVIVKFWLHIDKDEQKARFEARLASPDKQWKINGEDWRNRDKWDMYETSVDEMFFRTSTIYAPWTIVEANSKYYARIKVLETVIAAIEQKINKQVKTN